MLYQGSAQALLRVAAEHRPGAGLRRVEQLEINPGKDQAEDREHEQDCRAFAHLEEVIGIGVAHPRKHGGGAAGTAARHDPEQIERHDRIDRGQDHGEQQHRPKPGQCDLEKTLNGTGAVHACRTVQVFRHRLKARQNQKRGQRRLVPDVRQCNQVEGGGAVTEPVDRFFDQPEVEQDRIERSVLAVQHPSPEYADGDRCHRPGDEHDAPQKVARRECHVEDQRHARAEHQPSGNCDKGEIRGPAERGDELGVRQNVNVVVEADEDPLLGQHVDAMHAERQRVDQRNAEDDEDDEQRRRRQQQRQLYGWAVGVRLGCRDPAPFKQS